MRLSVVVLLTLLIAPAVGARTYYVDCASGSDKASGTTEAGAWKTIEKVSATTFLPGDSILFRRGARCSGSLWPKGSGEEGRPIRIAAYGEGQLPVVETGATDAAIKLFNQQYWDIENLESSGGEPYGLYIGASAATGTLRHFHLRNVVVHDVTGAATAKDSGLVVITGANGVPLEDVLIDGITAYRTTQWAGIYIYGSRNVVVRNSTVHDVSGDGIVLFQTENGIIEKSAAWLTGLQPTETIGTPNGIWTWSCRNCVVQLTEGFWTDSPGVDGGVYDIDYANDDNTVQYNYGHDAQGYCVGVFGAGKRPTSNSIVRYNICVNNGRSPKLARRQGDLFTMTWDGGSLDGVLIYNNTFFWNPPVDAPPVKMTETEFSGSRPNRFVNNVIYSTVPSMIDSSVGIKFQHNLYWYPGDSLPKWSYGGREDVGFASYRALATGELFSEPKIDWLLRPLAGAPVIGGGLRVPDSGAQDAFGTPLSTGRPLEIGAVQLQAAHAAGGKSPPDLPLPEGKWMLLLFAGKVEAEARSQLVFVQTAMAQYGDRSLVACVIADADGNLQYDWNFGAVRLVKAVGLDRAMAIGKTPAILLISPTGDIVRRWDGFAAPAELGLTLKHYLGSAPGDPGLDITPRQNASGK